MLNWFKKALEECLFLMIAGGVVCVAVVMIVAFDHSQACGHLDYMALYWPVGFGAICLGFVTDLLRKLIRQAHSHNSASHDK